MKLDLVLKAEYDTDADALYIYLPREDDAKVKHTLPVTQTTLLDLDERQNVVGVEILFFKKTRAKKKAPPEPTIIDPNLHERS